MTLYWILEYNVRDTSEFTRFLKSEKFKQIRDELEAETGIRILETYFAVDPTSQELSDYGCYDIWELPNYSAIDKYVKSKARQNFIQSYLMPHVVPGYKWITAEKQDLAM